MGERYRQIARWLVSLITFARVSQALLSQLLLIVAIPMLLSCLLQACGGGGGGGAAVPATQLTAITIDPVDSSVAVGTTMQLHATGAFSDGRKPASMLSTKIG